MMGCASRRDTRMLLLALIVAFAGALGVAGGWHAPRTEAQAGAYRWWLRDDEPPAGERVSLSGLLGNATAAHCIQAPGASTGIVSLDRIRAFQKSTPLRR